MNNYISWGINGNIYVKYVNWIIYDKSFKHYELELIDYIHCESKNIRSYLERYLKVIIENFKITYLWVYFNVFILLKSINFYNISYLLIKLIIKHSYFYIIFITYSNKFIISPSYMYFISMIDIYLPNSTLFNIFRSISLEICTFLIQFIKILIIFNDYIFEICLNINLITFYP